MVDAVAIGEPLIQLNSLSIGPLRHASLFERHVAGAESNFTIGVTRFGFAAGLISRVGEDEFGAHVLSVLRGEGVDVSQIRVNPGAQTGVYFIQRGFPIPGQSRVFYYRRGSAASLIGPDDVRPSYVRRAKWLHLTGITPALSQSCAEACEKAVEIASTAGVKISIDTNIRPGLWGESDPKQRLLPLISKAHLVFSDSSDSHVLLGEGDVKRAAKALMRKGPRVVVMKLGKAGAMVFHGQEALAHGGYTVPVVDPIGAGDALAAAFVSGLLKGLGLRECLRAGVVAGSLVTTTRGDFESIPSEHDVAAFLKSVGEV